MSRADAIARAQEYFDSGTFKSDLARRVAIATESQNPERVGELARYVESEMKPALEALGFRCRVMRHAKARGPFLYAERSEGEELPTVLGYGHGDVIRGLEAGWHAGLSPWQLVERDGCYWGRGVVDNKGQHTINLAALAAVLAVRGRLGFNAKWLIEMGEETGSAGLREICAENRDLFAADVLIASDGPRMAGDRATLSLGCRGAYPIDLTITAREGGHHSGNWGGLLSNPAIQLAHALASIAGPTGQVRIPDWVPKEIPDSVRRVLAECEIVSGPGDPQIDPAWGEPGLTAAEKVYVWFTFEVLAAPAIRRTRSTRCRRARGRAARCAPWSASIPMKSCRRCAVTSTARDFPWWKSPRRATRCSARRVQIPIIRGCVGLPRRSRAA